MRYDGRWRDRDPAEAPPGVAAGDPAEGAAERRDRRSHDLVQGEVTVANAQLDDMILLRADGTPTYMLAVVVDDHDMGVTHVIRGDDHLNNAFRQTADLSSAMGWPDAGLRPYPADPRRRTAPSSASGTARSASTPIATWAILPEALRNYLLRLGWSHGDDEIISTEQAIDWFDLDAVGRAPARFDLAKLDQPQRATTCASARRRARCRWCCRGSRRSSAGAVDDRRAARLERGMPGLKQRARPWSSWPTMLRVLCRGRGRCRSTTRRAQAADARGHARCSASSPRRSRRETDWSEPALEAACARFAEAAGREARRGRPAAARRADRLDRLARHLRGHGGAGPRRRRWRGIARRGRQDRNRGTARIGALRLAADAAYYCAAGRAACSAPEPAHRRGDRWTSNAQATAKPAR